MSNLDIPILNSLEKILQESLRMEDSIRWKKYVKRREAREENSLQHSYKASLLATIVIENEKKYSKEDFDSYLVLKATVLHDIGEIEEKDTVYIDKTDEGDRREHSFFQRFTSALPKHIKEKMDIAYDLQNSRKPGFSKVSDRIRNVYPLEVNLFDAIERLGYVLFAYREFREGSPKIFVQTLRNQHSHLVRLAEELPGFERSFYPKFTQDKVEQFLKKYKGQWIEQKGE